VWKGEMGQARLKFLRGRRVENVEMMMSLIDSRVVLDALASDRSRVSNQSISGGHGKANRIWPSTSTALSRSSRAFNVKPSTEKALERKHFFKSQIPGSGFLNWYHGWVK
jgi:hypothetical protein